ncbi:lysylphosphatidylglycerol synthase domain-containing protein [Vibrio natriegens]|uniref:lysylphosphatidylglycerol synthase domain-containing protein n=1 Tax=Vibrio natriegens TaxID=691 RepID=UPI003F870465
MIMKHTESVMAKLQAIREYKLSPSSEKKVLTVSMLALVVGVYLSLNDNPYIQTQTDWQAIAVVMLIGVPVTTLINALEFIISARMVGVNFPTLRAMKVSIVGSAANMLPLPGATMVRILALKASGVTFRKGTSITLLLALTWIGMSFFYTGVMLQQFDAKIMAWGLGTTGVCVLLTTAWMTHYIGSRITDYLRIVVLKLAMVLVDAVRIYFCFQALDLDVLFFQASAFVVSSVLGSAISIVPAGLGVRELVSAGLAPLVGIAASAGFLSATLNRIASLVALLPIASLLIWLDKEKKGDHS